MRTRAGLHDPQAPLGLLPALLTNLDELGLLAGCWQAFLLKKLLEFLDFQLVELCGGRHGCRALKWRNPRVTACD